MPVKLSFCDSVQLFEKLLFCAGGHLIFLLNNTQGLPRAWVLDLISTLYFNNCRNAFGRLSLPATINRDVLPYKLLHISDNKVSQAVVLPFVALDSKSSTPGIQN